VLRLVEYLYGKTKPLRKPETFSHTTGRGRLLVAPCDAGASGLSVLGIYSCAVPKSPRAPDVSIGLSTE